MKEKIKKLDNERKIELILAQSKSITEVLTTLEAELGDLTFELFGWRNEQIYKDLDSDPSITMEILHYLRESSYRLESLAESLKKFQAEMPDIRNIVPPDKETLVLLHY